jgi:hypothetical protein
MRNTTSGVMGCRLATPRMPSVPKSVLSDSAMGFVLARLVGRKGSISFKKLCKKSARL